MLVHGCLMDGIIRVKSHEFGKRSRLHKRYCILKDVYVVVYKSPRSQKPLLTIPLKDVNKVEETVRACVVCCVGAVRLTLRCLTVGFAAGGRWHGQAGEYHHAVHDVRRRLHDDVAPLLRVHASF